MLRFFSFCFAFSIWGLSFLPLLAFAGNFQVLQQSGQSIALAGAGSGVIADSAETAYYNPAGITQIKRQEADLSLIGEIRNIKYKGRIINSPAMDKTSAAQGGGFRVLPTILYAAPVNNKWGFGLSITRPFASEVNYGRNSFTHHITIDNRINTIDIGPSVGYQPFENLSVGLGVNAQYFSVEYNRLDGKTANDSLVKSGADDWSWGWNGGILWKPTSKTAIGLTYRSEINHKTLGKSRFTNSFTNTVTRTRPRMRVTLPASTAFSACQKITSDLEVLTTVNYTQWSQTKDVILTNTASAVESQNITFQKQLKNSWRFALGMRYNLSPSFVLLSGIAYDQSPIRKSYQNLVTPDSDKYLLALGFGYKINDKTSINFGYSHVFGKRRYINYTQSYGGNSISSIGNLDSSSDILGLQINFFMT